MNFDTTSLRAFVALAEHLHFARTAQLLNITPAKLTRLVQQLEKAVGEALFLRNTHGSSLTEAGRRMLPSAQRIVAECDWMARQMQPERTGAPGTFVIGSHAGVLYEDLPSRIRVASKRFPDIVYRLLEAHESALATAVADGTVDMGFTYFPPSDDVFAARVVSRRSQCVALSPEHPLAARMELRVAELAGETLLMPDEFSAPRLHQWYRSFLDKGSSRTLHYQGVAQIQSALGLCAAGVGVCVMPEHLRRLRTDDVRYVPLAGAPRLELSAFWRQDSPRRPVAQFLSAWK